MSDVALVERNREVSPLQLGVFDNDELVRMQAAQLVAAAGQLATVSLVERDTQAPRDTVDSLYSALLLAAEGNINAINMIDSNARTDAVERVYKKGMVIKVKLDHDQSGNISQHGQSVESIQANNLVYASGNRKMLGRSMAEINNSYRMKNYLRAGLLEDNVFMVVSHVPESHHMSEKEAASAGFFTDSMTLCIQLTYIESGQLVTESIFVAGRSSKQGKRFDLDAVEQLVKDFGNNYSGLNTTERLDNPTLIPRNRIPNIGVDVAKKLDEKIEKITGRASFFGQYRPKEDYLAFREKCRLIQANLEPKVRQIRQELIAERQNIRSKVDAIKKLSKISEKYMVIHALENDDIDTDVFGPESSAHIILARLHKRNDDHDAALQELLLAQATADSSSCPTGMHEEDMDCEFSSEKCPLCKAENVWTKVSKIAAGIKLITGVCGCSKIVTS